MKKKFIIEGLNCANCASKIEKAISKLEGVREVSVNFITQKLIIEAEDGKMDSIIIESGKIAGKIERGSKLKKA